MHKCLYIHNNKSRTIYNSISSSLFIFLFLASARLFARLFLALAVEHALLDAAALLLVALPLADAAVLDADTAATAWEDVAEEALEDLLLLPLLLLDTLVVEAIEEEDFVLEDRVVELALVAEDEGEMEAEEALLDDEVLVFRVVDADVDFWDV